MVLIAHLAFFVSSEKRQWTANIGHIITFSKNKRRFVERILGLLYKIIYKNPRKHWDYIIFLQREKNTPD